MNYVWKLTEDEASLDPPKGNALLLTTNTEVSIAPKLHRNRDAPSKALVNGHSVAANAKSTTSSASETAAPPPGTATTTEILRIIPMRLVPGLLCPDHNGAELLAFVSSRTLRQLEPLPINQTTSWFHHASYKRLLAPQDPSSLSAAPPPELVSRVLNAARKAPDSAKPSVDGSQSVYIGTSREIPSGQIVFSALPDGLEEGDLVRLVDTLVAVFVLIVVDLYCAGYRWRKTGEL